MTPSSSVERPALTAQSVPGCEMGWEIGRLWLRLVSAPVVATAPVDKGGNVDVGNCGRPLVDSGVIDGGLLQFSAFGSAHEVSTCMVLRARI